MVKKIGKRDFLLRVLSVLIAIGLWFYVAYAENPDIEVWFHGISVTYLGEGALEEQDLVHMKESAVTDVSMKIRGSRKNILNLSSHDITASVDLSGITAASSYSLPINASFPVSGFDVVNKNPYNVTVTVENMLIEAFEVELQLTGAPAQGYSVSGQRSDVESVSIKGPESIISSIKNCVAEVNIADISASRSEPAPIIMLDKDGEQIPADYVSFSNTYATVSLDVHQTKTVPVKADIAVLSGFAVKDVKTAPESVSITGSQEAISGITEIMTSSVRFAAEQGQQTAVASLILPESVEIEGGAPSVSVSANIEKKPTAE